MRKIFGKQYFVYSFAFPVLLCLAIAALLPVYACREELYQIAKTAYEESQYETTPYRIAALVEEGGSTKVLLSEGNSIIKSREVHLGAPSGIVYLDPRGWTFVTQGKAIHAVHDEWPSVMDDVFTSAPLGFAEDNGDTVTMVEKIVYRFDATQSPRWIVKYDYSSSPGIFASLFKASDHTGAYIASINTNTQYFRINDTSTPVITIPVYDNRFFHDRYAGMFYTGHNLEILRSDSKKVVPTSEGSFHSFAVVDNSNIFAGGMYSTHLEVMKMNFSTESCDLFYNFNAIGTSSIMSLAVFDSSTLIIGMAKNSEGKNGLYKLNINDTSLTQLSTLPVHSLSTLR